MIRLDFWNNPLVVSSFRVKYRRGGLFNLTTIYLLILVGGGVLIYHYQAKFDPWSWPKVYLVSVLGLQCVLSGVIAASATSASLRAEVVNRTLDFQRLVALSPKQILLGKLLGEPAVAYLLLIASFPIAAWCVALGVPGVSFAVLLLLYVNLACLTLLVSAMGLLQPLEPVAGKAPGSIASGAGGAWGVVSVMVLVQVAVGANWLMSKPWSAALLGLATPVPAFFGVVHDDPWQPSLLLFGLHAPFLLVTPLSELLLTYLAFQATVRRLVHPLNPPVSKKLAYVILIVADVLTGAVLFEPPVLGFPIGQRTAAFGLAHLLVGLWLTSTVSPYKEGLQSWIWRYRGRVPRMHDLWLGARSENELALVTFALIGLVSLLLFVLIPFGLERGFDQLQPDLSMIVSTMGVATLLLLTFGIMYQWCVALAGRAGRGVFATLVLFLVVPLHIIGYFYKIDTFLALSPSAHFGSWFSGTPPPSLAPLVIAYTVGLFLMWLSLRQYIARMQMVIQQKLRNMGVVPGTA
jgi:hypothetical protein